MTATAVSTGSPRAVSVKPKQSKERRAKRSRRWKVLGVQALVLLGLLTTWQLASGTIVHELTISKPTAVFPLFWSWLTDGTILSAAGTTFSGAFAGLLIGGIAGIIVGIILGSLHGWQTSSNLSSPRSTRCQYTH